MCRDAVRDNVQILVLSHAFSDDYSHASTKLQRKLFDPSFELLKRSSTTVFCFGIQAKIQSLDHIHYSRWLSVFIHDLELLCVENPDMFNSTGNNLGVRTSKAGFSEIAYDQKHEMNNKTIKSRGGYINLVNTKDTSIIWEKSRFVTQRWMSSWKI